MVCGYLPFDGNSFVELFTKIIYCSYSIPEFLSASCSDLISRMLVVEPTDRITLEEIRNHPWVLLDGKPIEPSVAEPYEITSANIDRGILRDMAVNYNIDPNLAFKSIINGKYNDEYATYQILRSRKSKIVEPPLLNRGKKGKKGHRRRKTIDDPVQNRDPEDKQASIPVVKVIKDKLPIEPPQEDVPNMIVVSKRKKRRTLSARTKKRHRRNKSADVHADKRDVLVIPIENFSSEEDPKSHENDTNIKIVSTDMETLSPREVRFPVTDNSTSTSAEVILEQLNRILTENNIPHTLSHYCYLCNIDDIVFEAEVCSLPILQVYGIRFNRIKGDIWEYHQICKTLLELMS
eukprot:TRINITY_DN3139_c0_g1_i1.p1 TRINITY_DN3139_c0_g1~~TRINITY_DN3139_c0_g1_i1.p1  ORF type:complete len:349 (-),score=72.52 TRINITY_DN3139_c0_g1_i1:31-1077(-)